MAENKALPIKNLALVVVFGLVLIFICLFVGSLLIVNEKIPQTMMTLVPVISLGISSLLTGLVTARQSQKRKLIYAILSGLCLYVCLIIISLGYFGEPMDSTKVIVSLIVSILLSTVGGVIGTVIKNKRKK